MNRLVALIIGIALLLVGGTFYAAKRQVAIRAHEDRLAAAEAWDVVRLNLVYPKMLKPAKALDLSNRLSESKKVILASGIADSTEFQSISLRMRAVIIANLFDTGQVVQAMTQCRLFKIEPSAPLGYCQKATTASTLARLESLIEEASTGDVVYSHEVASLRNMQQALTGNYPVFDDQYHKWNK